MFIHFVILPDSKLRLIKYINCLFVFATTLTITYMVSKTCGRYSCLLVSRQVVSQYPIREFKHQRRRRLQKVHLKGKFALVQSLSRLFHLVKFVKCWQIFLQLISKGLCLSLGKEKERRCLLFTSSTKREIRHFHVVVAQRRQRKCKKA